MAGVQSQEETELFKSFLARIQSSEPLAIPAETLQGALVHYLTTRTDKERIALVEAILESKSLWADNNMSSSIQQSFTFAVLNKVDELHRDLEGAYFSQTRVNRKARTWLSSIAQPTIDASGSSCTTMVQTGIVEGLMETSSVDWGHWLSLLEQELVLAAAGAISHGDSIALLASTMLLVRDDYLKALELDVSLGIA